MSSETVALLRQRLAVLGPLSIEIEDDSQRHAGHAGARDGGGHYNLTIVAAVFAGHNTVKRHRIVYEAASELMRGRIHALSIRALAPDEV